MKKKTNERTTIFVPIKIKDRVISASEANGITMSEFIRQAIIAALEKAKK